jgi:iron complex outermembrane receptor protein
LKTANPLEMTDDQKVVIGVRGSFNDQADDIYGADPYGQRLSLSFQKKLFDDKLGVALGYARLVQPRSATRFEQYNYETLPYSLVNDAGLNTTIVDKNFNAVPTDNRPSAVLIPDGFELFQTGGEETRDGYVAALQFEPTESLSIQSDLFYSKFVSVSNHCVILKPTVWYFGRTLLSWAGSSQWQTVTLTPLTCKSTVTMSPRKTSCYLVV